MKMINDEVFVQSESNVRSYCRNFPAVFTKALGSYLYDEDGNRFLDFLAGAGTLNYGHNNPLLKQQLIAYLHEDGVVHSLDLYTDAKRHFISDFVRLILEPRGLDYKLQFPGPTGTNAVEAALKLARKVTGRSNIIAFTNGFHGMSLGALAATANPKKRAGAGIALSGVTVMPFDGFTAGDGSSLAYIEQMLTTPGSGIEPPAGFLVETVQGEGGLNVASWEWLQGIARLARSLNIPLIIDDIQTGCGRTGRFFSFEDYQITPDIVCLSKSLSGLGLPLSLVLMRPELDVWEPGEHNGTFRGNNLGFVTASAALHAYWQDTTLQETVARKSQTIQHALEQIVALQSDIPVRIKGRGMMVGVEIGEAGVAEAISQEAFQRGLIIETCGVNDQVIKLLPPLLISDDDLQEGLDLLCDSCNTVFAERLQSVIRV